MKDAPAAEHRLQREKVSEPSGQNRANGGGFPLEIFMVLHTYQSFSSQRVAALARQTGSIHMESNMEDVPSDAASSKGDRRTVHERVY